MNLAQEFRMLESIRAEGRRKEALALYNARQEESEKWRKIVEKQDAILADKDAEIAWLRAMLGENR